MALCPDPLPPTLLAAPRRLPVGAEPLPHEAGVQFRVWAPGRRRVQLLLEDLAAAPPVEMRAEADGHFTAVVAAAREGTRYRFVLDGGAPLPDPASRFQPEGPHGPSQVVDPARFRWSDADWPGLGLDGQVFYELHVGTFTREGTWDAARRELPALAQLGVTAIELMPVADFPGRFGWGYDGVCWFAPSRLYGTPDDFRRFVDAAHAHGLGVLLDVVYNHFGPDGCYLREFAPGYFSSRFKSEWGDSPDFDNDAVREFVLASAACWIAEYHLDGLRLDATQSVFDDRDPHILEELGVRVRAAAGGRHTLVVNENEPQDARLVRPPASGGLGLDMIWNDDWHHSAAVAATAQAEAYYTDYRGRAAEFVAAARHGFLYQGQWYRWQAQRRGTPARDIEPRRFVHFLENHDQVANGGDGRRLHQVASPARWRALTALLLLGPQTPLLFQGQEFAADTPFRFFADHRPGLAQAVQRGRHDFMAQFANLAPPASAALLPVPHAEETFLACKLDHAQRALEPHRKAWLLHRDLLALRREDACLRRAQRDRQAVDGAALSEDAFVLRLAGADGDDRLLVVNLGRALALDPVPEPLLAPPAGARWRVAWCSQDPRYGGIGIVPPEQAQADRAVPGRALPRPFASWHLQGETAWLLVPEEDPS